MNDEMLLKKLDRIERKLDMMTEAERYMTVPRASKRLGVPAYRLKILCDRGDIPCNLLNDKSKYKTYKIDVIGAEKVLGGGGLIPKMMRR